VIVSVYVPGVVFLRVDMIRAEELMLPGVSGTGLLLKEKSVLAGRPLTLRLTFPL
jgi:hypothetical protein